MEVAGAANSRSNLLLEVARPVFASFRVVADEVLEAQVGFGHQRLRKLQHLGKQGVVGHDAQVGIDHRDAAGKVLDDGSEHVVLSQQLFRGKALFNGYADQAGGFLHDGDVGLHQRMRLLMIDGKRAQCLTR